MSTDIKFDSQRSTSWDEVGDIKTVSGVAQIRQSVVISILEGVDLAAPSLSSTEIEEQRGAIQSAVRRNENTLDPITVDVAEIDHDEQKVVYRVRTRRVNLPIETE